MSVRTTPPRAWTRYEYFDSSEVLSRLGAIEEGLAGRQIDDRVIHLRTHTLRPFNERRQAALFCHGMSSLMNRPVAYAPVEREDFDCIARWIDGDTTHYTPIQLKELPPSDLNFDASLENEIAKLAKYVAGSDLCVAIYLNRQFRFDLARLSIPKLNIAELWLFGSVAPDKSRWMLWGNLLNSPVSHEFSYPA